jgi:hypothetical protein
MVNKVSRKPLSGDVVPLILPLAKAGVLVALVIE